MRGVVRGKTAGISGYPSGRWLILSLPSLYEDELRAVARLSAGNRVSGGSSPVLGMLVFLETARWGDAVQPE